MHRYGGPCDGARDFFSPAPAWTLYLMKKDPKLLERRMSGGPTAEKETTQKIIMLFASLGFIGLIVFPALDHRFAWSHVPPYAALAGDVLVMLGWLAIFFVFKENTFTSATIELAPDQKVISTGPYASYGIRCTQELLSCFLAYRLRSVRGGGCSSSPR
jgi:protein-S-isoprenylcysteine O-methyltransferase Ste14